LVKEPGDSDARFGSGRLRPTGLPSSPISPIFSYPWSEAEPALQRLAAVGAIDPFDDVSFDYTKPLTGGHVMPTIGCRIQMLRPGIHTKAHRHAYTSVYHVFRGQGSTIVDGVRIPWKQGDFFTLPPFGWHEHHNDGSAPAYLFSTIDAPVIDALGLSREDAYPGDGHQPAARNGAAHANA
jgi:gentisate 1,2-dioxygenase